MIMQTRCSTDMYFHPLSIYTALFNKSEQVYTVMVEVLLYPGNLLIAHHAKPMKHEKPSKYIAAQQWESILCAATVNSARKVSGIKKELPCNL